MFTGLIQEQGRILSLRTSGAGSSASGRISIQARLTLEGARLGDSIAVDGVCLTIARFGPKGFEADIMSETLSRTKFRFSAAGCPVNLERAILAGEPFGGHIVSGHVDGCGRISESRPAGNAVAVSIDCGADLLRWIIPQGSVALDGASLTVTEKRRDGFSVSLIPRTAAHITLPGKKRGELVHIECDGLMKLALGAEPANRTKADALSLETLRRFGFA